LYQGEWVKNAWTPNYPTIATDIAHYVEATGDLDALEFAYAFAKGIRDGVREDMGALKIRPDGSFGYHTHMHTRTIWGVAHVGRLAGDTDLVEWARRVYEFVRGAGTDFGWFPERMVLPGEEIRDGYEERANMSETCVTGDMIQTATQLALAGHSHYWDHVERYVSNYLHNVQFSLTPAFAEWYREKHCALPASEVERGLQMVADFEGGFASMVDVNDWRGVGRGPVGMAGCCTPEAMRGLYTAWKHTAVTDGAGTTHVRMRFGRQTETVIVEPGPGSITVRVKRTGPIAIRLPAWVDRGQVTAAAIRGFLAVPNQVTPTWQGDEIFFEDAHVGDAITVTWQEPPFTQHVQAGGNPLSGTKIAITWLGNCVVAIDPPGRTYERFAAA
jgi:hypothetical protein